MSAMIVWFSILTVQVVQEDAKSPDQPAAVLAQQAADAIKKLDLGSMADRDAAEAALVELGPPVLDHLPAITDRTSEALRSRLLRVREELERRAAQQLAKASKVTLAGEMKLSEAIRQISEQSGNRIYDGRADYGQDMNDPTIATDIDEMPFLQALDTILDRAGLVMDPYVLEKSTVGFTAQGEYQVATEGRVAYSGRFRFEPLRAEAYRDLRNEAERFMRLGLEIAWEPKIAPVALTYLPNTISAVVRDGEPLSTSGPEDPTEIAVHETGSAVEIDIPFELPENRADKISKLSGRFEALVPGQYARFEFDQLVDTKPQTQSNGGVTVVLRRVREAQNLIDVWLLIRIHDADESLQSHRGWVYNNPAILVASDGTQHESVGMDTFRQEDAEFGISYKFDLAGDLTGYRFRYESPAAILSIPVEFELKDVPLP